MITPILEHLDTGTRPAYYATMPGRRMHAIGGTDPNSNLRIYTFEDTNTVLVISSGFERTSGTPTFPSEWYNNSTSSIFTAAGPIDEPAKRLVRSEQPTTDNQLSADLHRLKRTSGLTWEPIAELMGSSRQAVHKWAQGSAISQANRLRLSRVLAAINQIDQGTPSETLSLLGRDLQGHTLFDHLKAERFDFVTENFGIDQVPSGQFWTKVAPVAGEPPRFSEQLETASLPDPGPIAPIRTKPLRRVKVKSVC
jgi:DNA-binding transcriptional regulator YiaG